MYLNFPIKEDIINVISSSLVNILCIILIIYFVKKVYNQSIKDIGFRKEKIIKNIGFGIIGCIVALVIFLIGQVLITVIALLIGSSYDGSLEHKITLDIFKPTTPIGIVLYTFFYSIILLPIGEEMFFRGFVYPVIRKLVGIRWAIFLSALFFGLWHGMKDLWATFVIGIVFAYLYERTKSLIPCIVGHSLMNAKSAILVYFFKF